MMTTFIFTVFKGSNDLILLIFYLLGYVTIDGTITKQVMEEQKPLQFGDMKLSLS